MFDYIVPKNINFDYLNAKNLM